MKDKDRENFLANFIKRQRDSARREADSSRRKQDLMRQFENIFFQMTQHKWAEPFMKPVDVIGLGLHDYYEVIEKPMDFSTIKCKMEATDGTMYKNIWEICADVRLVFKSAMKYNDEKDDVDEKLQKEEESVLQLEILFSQEVVHAKVLDKVDAHLEELKEMALQNCRKMTTEEKKGLGSAITRLPPDDINKALEIIAQTDQTFQVAGETVEVDIDDQSESTLWKLKLLVKDTLQAQTKSSPITGGNTNSIGENKQNANNRRKREICEALVKNSQKKNKKLPTG